MLLLCFQYDDAVLRPKQRTVLRPRFDWLVEPLLGEPTRIRDQRDPTVPGGGLANLEVSFLARAGSSLPWSDSVVVPVLSGPVSESI